jgi:S1-C subfamily serine protease
LTEWTGKVKTPDGTGEVKFTFLPAADKDARVLMEDSKEIATGQYQVQGNDVTMSFFSGEVVYTGKIDAKSISGKAKDRDAEWDWSAKQTQAAVPGKPVKIDFKPTLTGSGVLIDARRKLLLTTCNVVGDPERVLIYFPTTEKGNLLIKRSAYKYRNPLRGRVVARDERANLALIQLESLPKDAKALPMARSAPKAGQKVVAVGNPELSNGLWIGVPGQVREVGEGTWRVLNEGLSRTYRYKGPKVEAEMAMRLGDNGGPFVNGSGALIGIAQAVKSEAEKINTCVDVREARAFIGHYCKKVDPKWVPEPAAVHPMLADLAVAWGKQLSPENTDAKSRLQAVDILAQMGDDAAPAFQYLFVAQKDADSTVAKAATAALEKVPPQKEHLAFLTECCKNSKLGPEICAEACKALAKLGADARPAAPSLMAVAKSSDNGLRVAALNALAVVGPEPADAAALVGLLTGTNPEVQKATLLALARIGPQAKGAVDGLVAALKSSDKDMRLQVLHTLEALGPTAVPAEPSVSPLLKSKEHDEAIAAARVLLAAGGEAKETLAVLKGFLQKDMDTDVQRAALKAIAVAGHEGKPVAGAVALKLEDDALRGDAAATLVRMGPNSISTLLTLLTKRQAAKENPDVRLVCVDIIRDIGLSEHIKGSHLTDAQRILEGVFKVDQQLEENRDAAWQTSEEISSRKN